MGQQLHLRLASMADAALLFGWANDPAVRANAFHPEPIAWEGHVAWLGRRLASANAGAIWVAEVGGDAAGQFRVDIIEEAADAALRADAQPPGTVLGEIGFSVAALWRGQGLGPQILEEGSRAAFIHFGALDLLRGTVKLDNPASSRSFLAAGFGEGPGTVVVGSACRTFLRLRQSAQGA